MKKTTFSRVCYPACIAATVLGIVSVALSGCGHNEFYPENAEASLHYVANDRPDCVGRIAERRIGTTTSNTIRYDLHCDDGRVFYNITNFEIKK